MPNDDDEDGRTGPEREGAIGEESTFQCPQCGEIFPSQMSLNAHSKLHRNARKSKFASGNASNAGIAGNAFDCLDCRASFGSKLELERHELAHREVRQKIAELERKEKQFAESREPESELSKMIRTQRELLELEALKAMRSQSDQLTPREAELTRELRDLREKLEAKDNVKKFRASKGDIIAEGSTPQEAAMNLRLLLLDSKEENHSSNDIVRSEVGKLRDELKSSLQNSSGWHSDEGKILGSAIDKLGNVIERKEPIKELINIVKSIAFETPPQPSATTQSPELEALAAQGLVDEN